MRRDSTRADKSRGDRTGLRPALWAALWAALDDADATPEAATLRATLAEARGVGAVALDGLLDLARDPDDRDVAQRAARRLTFLEDASR